MNKLLDAIVRARKNIQPDSSNLGFYFHNVEYIRLTLLLDELSSIIKDIPNNVNLFDFTVSSRFQETLWIDRFTYVIIGPDKRTYRLLKDTRNGRIVLAESLNLQSIIDSIASYIAQRLLERERIAYDTSFYSFSSLYDKRNCFPFINTSSLYKEKNMSPSLKTFLLFFVGFLFGFLVSLLLILPEVWTEIMSNY